jgi:hypothetical protein
VRAIGDDSGDLHVVELAPGVFVAVVDAQRQTASCQATTSAGGNGRRPPVARPRRTFMAAAALAAVAVVRFAR